MTAARTTSQTGQHSRRKGRLGGGVNSFDLFVPGRPAPQGSKRHVGGGVMIESSRAVGPWRTVVAWHAAQAYRLPPLTGALRADLDFVMPRPAACPKRSTPPALKRPDLDKLTRAVFDALSGLVWRDDSQVVRVSASKRLAEPDEQPGVRIQVGHVVPLLRGAGYGEVTA